MMNLSYNGTINNQWETLSEKVYKTSVDTLGHTTRKHQVLRFYHCLRKGVGHVMHFCPTRQETENCVTRKQNLNCKKSYEQFKMPGGTRKLMNYNS